MSLEDIHVTMGVQRVKAYCVLHVYVCLRQWEGCSILKVQTSKNSSKTFLKYFCRFVNNFYKDWKTSETPPPPRPKNTRASINNHKTVPRQ